MLSSDTLFTPAVGIDRSSLLEEYVAMDFAEQSPHDAMCQCLDFLFSHSRACFIKVAVV